MMSELEIFIVLDFGGEISSWEGLSERLLRSRRMKLKKLHQGKENFRSNQEEELEIVRTSDRDGKFKQQDCWNMDIIERLVCRLICNTIITVR